MDASSPTANDREEDAQAIRSSIYANVMSCIDCDTARDSFVVADFMSALLFADSPLSRHPRQVLLDTVAKAFAVGEVYYVVRSVDLTPRRIIPHVDPEKANAIFRSLIDRLTSRAHDADRYGRTADTRIHWIHNALHGTVTRSLCLESLTSRTCIYFWPAKLLFYTLTLGQRALLIRAAINHDVVVDASDAVHAAFDDAARFDALDDSARLLYIDLAETHAVFPLSVTGEIDDLTPGSQARKHRRAQLLMDLFPDLTVSPDIHACLVSPSAARTPLVGLIAAYHTQHPIDFSQPIPFDKMPPHAAHLLHALYLSLCETNLKCIRDIRWPRDEDGHRAAYEMNPDLLREPTARDCIEAARQARIQIYIFLLEAHLTCAVRPVSISLPAEWRSARLHDSEDVLAFWLFCNSVDVTRAPPPVYHPCHIATNKALLLQQFPA